MLAYANHTIHHGDKLVQDPGSVFELDVDTKEFDTLVGRDAIRAPTEDEVKLYKLANGELGAPAAATSEKAPAKSPKAGAADKPASTADENIG